MGSFNKKGNFSNLPIVYDDEVIAIIGLKTVKGYQELDNIPPGLSFTPLSLPFEGKYDDYGGVKDIVVTPAVKHIEEWFGKSIQDLVKLCERCTDDCRFQVEEDAQAFVDRVHGTLRIAIDEKDTYYSPAIIIEHKSVFDTIVDMSGDEFLSALGRDYDHDVKSVADYNLYEDKLAEYMAKSQDESLSESERADAKSKLAEYYEKFMDLKYTSGYGTHEKRSFIWHQSRSIFNMGERTGLFMLQPFSEVDLNPEWKDDFVRLAAFLNGMLVLQLTWGISSYYGQDYEYKPHRKFLEACMRIVEEGERLEKEWEDEDDER